MVALCTAHTHYLGFYHQITSDTRLLTLYDPINCDPSSTRVTPLTSPPPRCVQIGGKYVVDCGLEEELCSSIHLRFAVDNSGHVLSTSMEGVGAVPYGQVSTVIKVYT